MKKLILPFIIFTITFISCKTNKPASSTKVEETKTVVIKEQVKKEVAANKNNSTTNTYAKDDLIAAGKVLFYEKTCTACHAEDSRVIGPSIKEIAFIYTEKNGNIVKYLKGNADAIVDTDPAQVAIMNANIDGIAKDIKPEDLQAIAAYIRSVK
jgi:cytochrome c